MSRKSVPADGYGCKGSLGKAEGKMNHRCAYPDGFTPMSHRSNGRAHTTFRPHFPALTGCFIADCYCGEGPPLGNLWDGECDIPCEDSPSSCGGEYTIVLYDIPLPDTAPELQLTIDGTSRLLGCFPFNDNLNYLTHGPFIKWGLMTNEVGTGCAWSCCLPHF